MRKGLKGVPIPEENDDLLDSFEVSMNSAGIVIRVQNVAAARTMLSAAEAAGRKPSAEAPWYFDINSILYKADGAKGGNQVWDLKCLGETEFVYSQAGPALNRRGNLGVGSYLHVVDAVIGAKPYDRAFMAHGTVWCRINGKGSADVELYPDSKDTSTPFRSRVNSGDDGNTEVTGMGKIPANKTPSISLWIKAVKGDDGNALNHINITTSADTWTRLHVILFPTSMY